MSGGPFYKSDTYHYPSGVMHEATCGVVIRPDDLSAGLTTAKERVNCPACRRLLPKPWERQTWDGTRRQGVRR